MHKLPVGAGFIGLVFAVGTALIFVIGFPALWSFVAFSAAFGIVIAIFRHLASDRQSKRNQPLSILRADEKAESPVAQQPEQRPNLLRSLPMQAAPLFSVRRAPVLR
jgi:hypothetical protein